MTKHCSRCTQTLPVENFSKDKSSKDGYQHYCKDCFSKRYQETAEHHKEMVQAWKDKFAPVERIEKLCKTCGEMKLFPAKSRKAVCGQCIYKQRQAPCPECGNMMAGKSKSCRPCSGKPGELNPNWKGGSYRHAKGYILIRVDGKYRMEHDLVMEDFLGRKLLPGETVHHKFGIKCDNRLEKLELWASPQPSGIRALDLLEWARGIVAEYEPLEEKLRLFADEENT